MAGLRPLPCQHLPGRRACSRLRRERSRSNGCRLGALLRWPPLQRKTRIQSILPAQPLQSMPIPPPRQAVQLLPDQKLWRPPHQPLRSQGLRRCMREEVVCTQHQRRTLIRAKHSSVMSRQQTSAAQRQSSRAIRQRAPCKHWHRTAGHLAGKSLMWLGAPQMPHAQHCPAILSIVPACVILAAFMRPGCADTDRSLLVLGCSCWCPCCAGRGCWPAMMVSQRQAAAWEPSLAGGGPQEAPAASAGTAARTTAGDEWDPERRAALRADRAAVEAAWGAHVADNDVDSLRWKVVRGCCIAGLQMHDCLEVDSIPDKPFCMLPTDIPATIPSQDSTSGRVAERAVSRSAGCSAALP